MAYNHYLPQKVDLTPKRHHGFQVVLFFLGWLLPPLAVAVRFGIGRDFFINYLGECGGAGASLQRSVIAVALVAIGLASLSGHRSAQFACACACALAPVILTLCGYIPGHGHNFYIQNIRNNSNKARTPKWAIRYGLVNNAERERKARKSQWAKRYDERLPESTFVGQELAEGEEGPNYDPVVNKPQRRQTEGLWDRDDEQYYNEDEAPNQRNWHYPLNFEGTVGDGRSRRNRLNRTSSRASSTGDRFERTRSARADADLGAESTYPPRAATDDDVPVWGKDYGRQRRSSRGSSNSGGNAAAKRRNDPDAVFDHEF